jgi:Hint domain
MCVMDFDLLDDGDLLSRVLEQTTSDPEDRTDKARRASPEAPAATWTLPGLLGSTRVATSFGHVPAQLVRVGDTLRTREGNFVRVQRITDLRIDEDFLARRPDAAPVMIRRNGLRAGTPHQDVALSPGQMVSVGPNRFEDRLVRADTLSRERGGIDRTLGMMVYIRLHLAESAQINCDGLWVAAEAD